MHIAVRGHLARVTLLACRLAALLFSFHLRIFSKNRARHLHLQRKIEKYRQNYYTSSRVTHILPASSDLMMTRDGWQPCTCAVKKAGQVCHVKKAGQVSREGRLGRVPTDGAACAGLHPSSDAIAVVTL